MSEFDEMREFGRAKTARYPGVVVGVRHAYRGAPRGRGGSIHGTASRLVREAERGLEFGF